MGRKATGIPTPVKDVRKPWHSVLAQLLREDLTPLGFKVEQEVELGRLPLRADIIVIHAASGTQK